MPAAHVEYVGFSARGETREYRLRVRQGAGDDPLQFTLIIPNEAFTSRRVRYQDAPEICFLKLQRALLACANGLPEACLTVSDAELEDYRTAHTRPQRGGWPTGS